MTIFKLGELFCGPGGLACGALQSQSDDGEYSLEHAWANDYDADTCSTYIRNICPNRPETVHLGDVKELDIESLGEIDAFAYGFPCNSFSTIGKHQVILNDMRESGYRLNVNLYKAEKYGIPQTRHRVIIVGIREDLDVVYRVPDPAQFHDIDISSRTALHNIPVDAPNNEIRQLSEKVIRRLNYIAPGENVWQAEANMPEELHIKTKTKISQIYRKLDPDKPSYTITAAGGGGTYGYHWTNRELTNRERARIQTFPDNYEFVGKYASVRKQIGMAVPCRLSEIVTTAILNSFAGIDYPWVEPNLQE